MDVAPDVRRVTVGPERRRAHQSPAAVDQPDVLTGLGQAPPISDVALGEHRDAEHRVLRRAGKLGDRGSVGVGCEANVEAVRERRAHRAPPGEP